MRSLDVYDNDTLAGHLTELSHNKYQFVYDEAYFANPATTGISVTLPKTKREYISDSIFPFFTNMLPEGFNRRVICRLYKVDPNDFFGLLMVMRNADFIGAINLR